MALVEHQDRPDDIGLAVFAVYPHPSLIAPSFMERHDALDAFLAVMDPSVAVPATIRGLLSTRHLRMIEDVDARVELQQENASELRKLPIKDSAITLLDATTCSVSFRNWAAGVFGGDGTCGQVGDGSFNFITTNTSRTRRG